MLQLGNAHTLIWCLLLCDATLRNLATSVHQHGSGVLFIMTADRTCTMHRTCTMRDEMDILVYEFTLSVMVMKRWIFEM